jgi:hypothetical protein
MPAEYSGKNFAGPSSAVFEVSTILRSFALLTSYGWQASTEEGTSEGGCSFSYIKPNALHVHPGKHHETRRKLHRPHLRIAFETLEQAQHFEHYLKSGSGHAFANRHFWL